MREEGRNDRIAVPVYGRAELSSYGAQIYIHHEDLKVIKVTVKLYEKGRGTKAETELNQDGNVHWFHGKRLLLTSEWLAKWVDIVRIKLIELTDMKTFDGDLLKAWES